MHCRARIDAEISARLQEVALAAHQLLGLRDVSRMDAIVDHEGRIRHAHRTGRAATGFHVKQPRRRTVCPLTPRAAGA